MNKGLAEVLTQTLCDGGKREREDLKKQAEQEDLLQLFKALLNCCCDVLNVVVYPIDNGPLFGA